MDSRDFVVGVSQRLSLENSSPEVDAAQVSGDDDNEYGLVCGYQDEDGALVSQDDLEDNPGDRFQSPGR